MATRSQVEKLLLQRTGQLLTKVGLDGTTSDGTNENLADPIGWALSKLSAPPADPTEPIDAEVAAVGNLYALLDLAELRTLENILGNMDLVTAEVGPRREEYNDLAKRLLARIPAKRKEIEKEYGIALGEQKAAKFTVW